jgi:rhamnogalacturonan endolyase
MEKLGRGFVAVGGGTGTLLSWRLYGTEQGTDVAFNVYKGTTKLNSAPITTSTNYQDTAAGGTDYTLKAIVGGVEEATGTKALSLPQGYLEIPIKDAGGRKIHLAYVGDLDGDGEYEYIVDRFQAGASQYVDAYHRNGTFMWRVDMGPNSTNTDLSLSGPDTISCGHADDETVYDIDSDGKAELILRGANGMIFGDGTTLKASTTQTDQFIVAVDGVTGAEKGKECAVPSDLLSVGNSTGHFSIAYWDGVHPSLYYKAKAGGTAAMMDLGYDFKDNAWSLRFKAVRTPINSYPNNHNLRCVDLDRDGIDECVNGGYAIKGDGSIFWNMGSQGVSHGDRWHIGAMDPNPSADLLGWAIGQRSGYDWVEYNAKTGTLLRKVGAGTTDLARGVCGDVDPAQKGYECWTGGSVYNMLNLTGSPIGSGAPAQNFRIFWDGDVLAEVLDSNTVSKWAYPGAPSGGFTSANLAGLVPTRNAAPLYGDMFGDWREEVLFEQSGSTSIRIYSTAIPTDKRIYTLVHDPEYRNSMCEKGYQQSHMLDFYLGDGMADPPAPKITYPTGTPSGPSGGAGAGGGATTGAAGAGGGGTTEAGGAGGGAAGGRGGRGGNTVGGGGTTGPGVTTVANTGGNVVTGGTPGTGGAAGGNPATAASTVGATGGSVVSGTGGATGVASETGGSTGSGAEGGAVGGESGTIAPHAAEGSGCSCAIGAASGHASAGYLVALLGMLGVVLGRRRRR